MGDEVTRPRPEGREAAQPVQVLLNWDNNPQAIRSIKSSQVSQLVKISGIIIAASQVHSPPPTLSLQKETDESSLGPKQGEDDNDPVPCLPPHAGRHRP